MYRDYTDVNYKVFGLYGMQGEFCECGNKRCTAFFKHPRITSWQKVPVWSETQLDNMEARGDFKTGFGVLVDGFLVIDIDPRNGGSESYDALCKDLGLDLKDQAGFVVETGGGGWHIYYQLPNNQGLVTHLKKYPGIDFKSSGFVVGAGSIHRSGAMYEIEKGGPDSLTVAPGVLLELLKRKAVYRVDHGSQPMEVGIAELEVMVSYIDADCGYDDWLHVGMALHECTAGTGFAVWDNWSATGQKYKAGECDGKWHGFGKSKSGERIGYGTLHYMAVKNGYKESVTFEHVDTVVDESVIDPDLDISHIDICKPPGLIGELVEWVNGQCRFPRERIAVGATLATLGNLAGLNYFDDDYGVTTNLFVFCVAGSATGKEAVISACSDLHIKAGLGTKVRGSIKSEQEVYRGVVENRQAFYFVDEIGFLLKKLSNAQKRGGADYLVGVMGALMSVYSKGNGNLTVGSEQRLESIKKLNNELAGINQAEDENLFFDQDRKLELEFLLNNLHLGYVEKPFMSLIGFTTPVTFNEAVDYESSTNGFIGRSILIHEKETNPSPKIDFRPPELPLYLQHFVCKISAKGVGRQGIKSTEAALNLLKKIQMYFHKEAEKQKINALEAIPRRSFEQVLKVSTVCALADGVRDIHHVQYAFAFILHDLKHKINLAASNVAAENHDKDQELLRKIINILDEQHKITTGVISNRLRKFKKESVLDGLKYLQEADIVQEIPASKSSSWLLKKGCQLPT